MSQPQQYSQHILGFSVHNFKKIEAFNVDLRDKNTLIISGKNDQGKTSLIDALHACLAGKKYYKNNIERPIKEGEEQADVFISTDKYEIHRYWKRETGKDYIKIEDKRGVKQGSEETLLREFYSDWSRDPQRMDEMDRDEQVEFLYDLLGLQEKLEELDEEYNSLYESRRQQGREVKRLKGKLDSMPEFEEVPEKINMSQQYNKLEQIREHNQKVDQAKQKKQEAESEIEDLRARIEQLQETVQKCEDFLGENEKQDPEPVKQKIENAEQQNEQVRKAEEYFQTLDEYEEEKQKYDELDQRLQDNRNKRQEQINDTDMPVEGMDIEDGQITYEGTPVKDLGKAASIIFWSQVFMATNPELRFLTLDNGESLDSEHLRQLDQFAKQEDLLYIITIVDESGDTGIVIEDGTIKENNYEQ